MTLQTLKKLVNKESGLNIDFRTDVYLNNTYGATPCIDYERAKNILKSLYAVLNRKFGCYSIYNLNMSLEKLKTQTLKSFFEIELFTASNYKQK